MSNPEVMSTPERDRRFGADVVTVKFYKGNMENVERLTREQAEALRQSLTAFLDEAPDPEWEYQCTNNINTTVLVDDPKLHAMQCSGKIERRRKAGPWIPVEED